MDVPHWKELMQLVAYAPPLLLGIAISAVGLSTDLKALRGFGWRPFAVGGLGALVVALVGLGAVKTVERFRTAKD